MQVALKSKVFLINQNLKDLGEFNELLNKYEEAFLLSNASQQVRTDFAKLNPEEVSSVFIPMEGGRLWEMI